MLHGSRRPRIFLALLITHRLHPFIPAGDPWVRTVTQQLQEMRGAVYRSPMQTRMAPRSTTTVEDCEYLRSFILVADDFLNCSHVFAICVAMPWNELLPSSKSGFGQDMTEAFRVRCRVAQVASTRTAGYVILFEYLYLAGIGGVVVLCLIRNAHVTHAAVVCVPPSHRELRTPTSQTRNVTSPRTFRPPT